MPLGGRFHRRDRVGIGQQFADGRVEKIHYRVDLDVASASTRASISGNW